MERSDVLSFNTGSLNVVFLLWMTMDYLEHEVYLCVTVT